MSVITGSHGLWWMFLARHYSLPLLAKRVTAVSLRRKCSWNDDKGWISAGPIWEQQWDLLPWLAGNTQHCLADPKNEPQAPVLLKRDGGKKKVSNLPC